MSPESFNKYAASPKNGDPANPAKYPKRYAVISCAACSECVFDKLVGRCLSGGPYNRNLELDMRHCRIS